MTRATLHSAHPVRREPESLVDQIQQDAVVDEQSGACYLANYASWIIRVRRSLPEWSVSDFMEVLDRARDYRTQGLIRLSVCFATLARLGLEAKTKKV